MGDAAHAMVPFYGQGMNAVSRETFTRTQTCTVLSMYSIYIQYLMVGTIQYNKMFYTGY